MNTKNNKPTRFFGELHQLSNGQFKVAFIEKLVGINQHKNKWVGINGRNFARELNRNGLVIK